MNIFPNELKSSKKKKIPPISGISKLFHSIETLLSNSTPIVFNIGMFATHSARPFNLYIYIVTGISNLKFLVGNYINEHMNKF